MFTVYHFIWLGICVLLMAAALLFINKKHITLRQLLPVCCVISVVSELIKTLSVFKIVPSADGNTYYPYLEVRYLPFHLCSILIFVIFYITFGENEKLKNELTGYLYAAGILGGILGICLPSIFSTVEPSRSYLYPLAYQTFIYHSMLIVLGITIYRDKEFKLSSHHFKITFLVTGVLSFFSLYLNSMLASPVYEGSELKSVENTTNFFFTYRAPINVQLNTKEQWYIYLFVITFIGTVSMFLVYIPVFRRDRRSRRNK